MFYIGHQITILFSIKIPPDLSGTKYLIKITRLFVESQDLILRPFRSF